ncbi:hypothetical protein U1710_10470, partial [Aeromonas caviae]|uniref:hypothetical protein n=1 Tax=Aeromonas caviae TaxID=648 RepID=UPI003014686A
HTHHSIFNYFFFPVANHPYRLIATLYPAMPQPEPPGLEPPCNRNPSFVMSDTLYPNQSKTFSEHVVAGNGSESDAVIFGGSEKLSSK